MDRSISTHAQTLIPSLYLKVIGERFYRLPQAIQDLHTFAPNDSKQSFKKWKGQSNILRSTGWFNTIIAHCMNWPVGGEKVCTTVAIFQNKNGESWHRQFAEHKFCTYQYYKKGCLYERVGWIHLRFDLQPHLDRLELRLNNTYLFGWLRLPKRLTPSVFAQEMVNTQGKLQFDVLVQTNFGLKKTLLRYTGYLEGE